MLSDRELLRYSRQLLLEGFDISGQEKLKNSRVLIVGLGGLGCIVSMYLTGAGIGSLVLADGDKLDLTNLHRQILYKETDVNKNKALAAKDNLSGLNDSVEILAIDSYLDSKNLPKVLCDIDLVVDATDNYTVRFELNTACLSRSIPIISAAAARFEGQIAIIDPALGGPCYRCLYTDTDQTSALSCSESGVLPPLLGVLGSLQAFEVIRYLSGLDRIPTESLLFVDLLNLDFRRLKHPAKSDCLTCSHLRGKKTSKS